MLRGNCNNPFAKTYKLPRWVCKCLWSRSMSFYGCFAGKQKNGSAFHDTWVRSPLPERCKSACLQHVLSYRDLWVHMCALLPFRVEEALETDAGELCKKEHQASFCPRDVGQQSPEVRTLRCEWQACRAARVGAGLVHTSAGVRECTSGNSMPHQPRSPYLKTVSQFLLQSFVEGL